MKTFKIALAMFAAAVLPLAFLASPSSGAPGTDDQAADSGNLYQTPTNDTSVHLSGPFTEGQQIKLYANFSGGVRNVNFYRAPEGSNTWTKIGTDEANTYGNAYLNYTVVAGDHKIYAEDVNDLETETDPIEVNEPPPPGTAVLNSTSNPKVFTATFNPADSGASTRLEAQEICTYETDETNPASGEFNKDVKQSDCQGPWTTRDTSTQNSSGNTTFTLPTALQVKHKYRAISGGTTSNVIEYAAPLPTDPYGIDTGLSELHFNTYEDDDVNTRSRYFEGAFSMTGSEKSFDPDANGSAAPCAEAKDSDGKTVIMKSVMKGRGNWSWTFPKKSFSLKIDKKIDLCGLGKSKKFALVANDFDKSLMRNTLANYMGQKFSKMGWTPKSVPVEFYMNGAYRGSYILIERISIQGTKTGDTYSRLDLDELKADNQTTDPSIPNNNPPNITGGYVLEWDYRRGADFNALLPYGSDSYVGVKEPENDYDREGDNTKKGISSQQKSYIQDYLRDADAALRGSNYRDNTSGWQKYIDKDSAVDYYIAMEYMKPFDGNMWTSVYMYKPRADGEGPDGDGKLRFGPMWDFDLSAGSFTRSVPNLLNTSGWYLRNNQNTEDQQPLGSRTWFNRLNEDPEFKQAVADRWNAVENSLNVTGLIDTQKSLLSQSQVANFKRWSYSNRVSPNQLIKGSWSSDVSYLRNWAGDRKNWIDSVCATGTEC